MGPGPSGKEWLQVTAHFALWIFELEYDFNILATLCLKGSDFKFEFTQLIGFEKFFLSCGNVLI